MAKSFAMLGARGGRDKKGVVTLTVPYFVQLLQDCLTVGASPPFEGLIETDRTWDQMEDANYQVTVTYQGAQGDSPERLTKEQIEFDGSFGEEPIETHPDIEELKQEYGGVVGEDKRITFPQYLPDDGNANSGSALNG